MIKKIVQVKHLTKEYKNLKAIDDLSFEVYEGEILGLLGPNGSGKSTTINCILSLLEFGKGSIQIFGNLMNLQFTKILITFVDFILKIKKFVFLV